MEGSLNDLKHSDLQYNGVRQAEKVITFAGATTDGIGDFDGTGNPFDIFSVTGTVIAKVFALCTTTLEIDATATLETGTALSTAALIALTAGDAIDVNEIWHDAAPDASIELSSILTEKIISQDVIGTVATANINTGVLKFICLWKPISKDGNVVAA